MTDQERIADYSSLLFKEDYPVYLSSSDFSDPHKRAYLSTLGAFRDILEDVHQANGEKAFIIVPGVGGIKEPGFLFDTYGEGVISLDYSPAVIERHKTDNKRLEKKGQCCYEFLVHGDARIMPFSPDVAKLISFSSVMPAIVSAEEMESLSLYGKGVDKEEVVIRQIRELQRLVVPGGILAIQQILPQPQGIGSLTLETEIAENFYMKAFLSGFGKRFMKQDSYRSKSTNDKMHTYGTFADLSEIWWHFRWWWVNLRRYASNKEIVEPFLQSILARTPSKKEVTQLHQSHPPDFLSQFDETLEPLAVSSLRPENPLAGFREWREMYNTSNGIRSPERYVSHLFREGHWNVAAYTYPDSRDNALLDRHFGLYNEVGQTQLPIDPQRLIIYALSPTENEVDDKPRFQKMIKIADAAVGREHRILPVTK